jgi:hypothetical protein
MTIHADIVAALTPVLANTWAAELPEQPTWPAIVFDVDTDPEQSWVLGGGYDQHTVAVVVLAKTRTELATLQGQVDSVIEALPGYLRDEERGDADYEDDASVYAYFSNFVIRKRRI